MLSKLIRGVVSALTGGRRRRTTTTHRTDPKARAAKGVARAVKKKL